MQGHSTSKTSHSLNWCALQVYLKDQSPKIGHPTRPFYQAGDDYFTLTLAHHENNHFRERSSSAVPERLGASVGPSRAESWTSFRMRICRGILQYFQANKGAMTMPKDQRVAYSPGMFSKNILVLFSVIKDQKTHKNKLCRIYAWQFPSSTWRTQVHAGRNPNTIKLSSGR